MCFENNMSVTTVDRYAVMGNPIAHSKSPIIYQLFARQTQQQISYEKILVPVDDFYRSVTEFFQQGGKGISVTLPFKQEAITLAHECTKQARIAGAASTLMLTATNKILADNTDGVGLVRDLTQNHQIILNKRRILLIGAGGAVRNVLASLVAEQPTLLHIANRTAHKAEQLCRQFTRLGKITASGLDNIEQSFDLIINATSASLQNECPPLSPAILASDCCCYDMVYANEATAFLRWAQAQGVTKIFDGLGMLVEHSAAAFHLWRGIYPDPEPVIQYLRQRL